MMYMKNLKRNIDPLSKSEITILNSVMDKIKYTVQRSNVKETLHSGYCKVSLYDFDNEKIHVEVECKIQNEIELIMVTISRRSMEIIWPQLEFNPENN